MSIMEQMEEQNTVCVCVRAHVCVYKIEYHSV